MPKKPYGTSFSAREEEVLTFFVKYVNLYKSFRSFCTG
jgi:hypothetical protein